MFYNIIISLRSRDQVGLTRKFAWNCIRQKIVVPEPKAQICLELHQAKIVVPEPNEVP